MNCSFEAGDRVTLIALPLTAKHCPIADEVGEVIKALPNGDLLVKFGDRFCWCFPPECWSKELICSMSEFEVDARLLNPPLPAMVERAVVRCDRCGLIRRDCEYGLHQVAIKWSAGLCKCKA